MARPESVRDLMHVPTPPEVVERLRRLLLISPSCHALDPCCGDGTAIQLLAPDSSRYGIELEITRAAAAKQRARVLNCAMQDARVSHDAFGAVLLNPPYDDSTEGRLERVFLDRTTRYLRRGGILILIIKESLYDHVTWSLRRDYDVIGHWRFPDPYFDGPELAFGQTVLVARRREVQRHREHSEWETFAEQLGLGQLEPLPETFDERVHVPAGCEPRVFISGELSASDLAELVRTSPLSRQMRVPPTVGCGRPPVSLKQGHIAMVLASGLVNGAYGDGPTRHVAKGTVVRTARVERAIERTPSGSKVLVETTTDSFAIHVRAMTRDGLIHEMAGAAAASAEAEADDE